VSFFKFEKKSEVKSPDCVEYQSLFSLAGILLCKFVVLRVRLKMKRRFTVSFGMLVLSLLFTYAGVAWAFDPCPRDSEDLNAERSVTQTPESKKPLSELAPSLTDQSQSAAHCARTEYEFDVIAPTSSLASLNQFRKVIHLASLQHGPISSREMAPTFQRSRPAGIILASPPGLLSLHLILSVFLI
jgi:hypothetical protein